MILLIDNYDSFVYNLYQYLGTLGAQTVIYRNDAITLEEIRGLTPSHIILSPGPCTPDQAGICLDLIRHFAGIIPILGVCLGHQAIGQAFGGEVVRAKRPMHGKISSICHSGRGIFNDIPSPLNVTRYHSLIVRKETLPSCLEVTAQTIDGEIMGLHHREFPVQGVQFHPEAFLTESGHAMIRNFIHSAG